MKKSRQNPTAKRIHDCLQKAQAAIKSNEFEFARQYAQQALGIDPESPEAKAFLEAIPVERARRWNFISRSWHALMALLKVMLGKYEVAVGVTEALAKSKPNKVIWWKKYGLCCSKLARWPDAVDAYEKALALKPNDFGILSKLGELYTMVEKYEKAVRIYEKLSSIKPKDGQIQRAYKNATAQAYSRAGVPEHLTEKRALEEKKKLDDQQQAEERLEARKAKLLKTVDEHPEDTRSRLRLARLLANEQDFEPAAEILQKGVDLFPDDLKLLEQLASVQEKAGQIQDALQNWKRISEANQQDLVAKERILALRLQIIDSQLLTEPDNQDLQKQRAEVNDELLDIQIPKLEADLDADPQNIVLTKQLGESYRRRGRVDDAIHIYQALAKSPTKAFLAFTLLGEAFSEKGIIPMAIEQYEKALEKAPSRGSAGVMRTDIKSIHYALGELYESIGQLEKSLESFKAVYEEDINFKDIRIRFEQVYAKLSSPQ